MRSLERINEYVLSVCQQIRWKKAHMRVLDEMTNHIIDGRDSYINQGFDEQTATEKAIIDTGDASVIGTELDRIHRPKSQWVMFIWVAGFVFAGLAISLFVFGNENISNRLLWTAIGAVLMVGAYFADFTILGKHPWKVCLGIVLFALIIFSRQISFLGMGHTATIQAIVLLFPIAYAPVIFASKGKGYLGIVTCLLAYGLLCIAAFEAPAMSGFLHFVIIGKMLLIVAILRNWFGVNRVVGILLALVPYACIFAFLIFHHWQGSYFTIRLINAFFPRRNPQGAGFIALVIWEILGNATLLGEGAVPGFNQTLSWLQLPLSWLYSDFILSTIISRFGWLIFALTMGVILLFMANIIVRCVKLKSDLGFFVSTAVALTILVQIFMYVLSNLGYIFAIISLPLISPGNTAMVINMGIIGFMLSVFRTGVVATDKNAMPATRENGVFTWHNGKLTIDFGYRRRTTNPKDTKLFQIHKT